MISESYVDYGVIELKMFKVVVNFKNKNIAVPSQTHK